MATQAELAEALAKAQVAKSEGEKTLGLTAVVTAEPTPAKTAPGPITIHGRAGLNYNIVGEGFGTTKGQVLISGRAVEVTAWTDKKVKGPLPPDLKPGPVELRVGDQVFVGWFGKKAA